MKILIIHHLEEIWNAGYKQIGNTNFDELKEKFYNFIFENNFDKVILTKFEFPSFPYFKNNKFWEEYQFLGELITDCHEYQYSWDKESLIEANCEFCDGGNHSEVVLIEDWMKELKDKEVFISGAFDNECIEDLEIALNYCNVNFKRIEELIV